MIASTSAIHAHNLFGQKPSPKFASSSFHSYSERCFEIRATEATKEPSHQHDDEDTNVALHDDLYYKIPKSLNWLLNPPEKTKLPLPIKALQKINNANQSSFGVILDFKGVIVENDDPELDPTIWHILSLEEEKTFPSNTKLQQIQGIRTEKAILEILNWSEDQKVLKRIANRKEMLYKKLHGPRYKIRLGTLDFISTLINFNVPIALVSELSTRTLKEAVDSIGLKGCFDAMLSVQDMEEEEEESLYEVAASSISIGRDRCVVFCKDEAGIESAKWAGMRCVGVASRCAVYELCAADHVVRWLDEVSFGELSLLAHGEGIGSKARRHADMEIVSEK